MKKLLILFILCLSNILYTVQATPTIALGYTPKYPDNFSHFDYVNPNAPKGGEIVMPAFGNFESLNPFLLKGISASGLTELLFQTLMAKSEDEPFSVYPLIAKDIQLAADKLSVTFKLNPKARFSDGSELTTEDVKFSFDTLKSDQAHPQYRLYWADVRDAEIIDKHTIRFNFLKENPELHLIIADLPIFSKMAVGDKEFTEIVTEPLLASGPYLMDSYKAGDYITYKRNPNYWAVNLPSQRGMYNFDRITFKYYQDEDVALEALKAGDFDVLVAYNSKKWARDYEGPKFDSGEIQKTQLVHQNNAGMQGFVFNLRHFIFQDVRVRKAINLAFDFSWSNKNLFYDQYLRCDSYFSNSELAASKALPEGDELTLLTELQQRFPNEFPATVLTEIWQPVDTLPPHDLRKNLRQAKQLLTEAGWILQNDVLQKGGLRLEFELITPQKGFERILAPFARNLEKLGIHLNYRVVDTALYQKRVETFDFDMVITIFAQSQSPGNELMNTWHSVSAEQNGSNNLIGLKNPLVDALIEKIIYAKDRTELVTATHALDRVMLHGEYVVPNWYINTHRIAYWDKFSRPKQEPLYYRAEPRIMESWWAKNNTTPAK